METQTQIARILALELRGENQSQREFRFHDEQNVYLVKFVREPSGSEFDKGMHAVCAPGEPCPCCKGAGVRSELVPIVAR